MHTYFNDENIINQLCKERVKLAGARNNRQYIDRLVGHQTESTSNHPFYNLLPPRRLWSAYRLRYRSSNQNPDLLALKRAVRALRFQEPLQPWAVELNRYIAEIQARVMGSPTFAFTQPTINCERKSPIGSKYRALCQFNSTDNLILCLFARYLRDKIDGQFSSSSYAFRATNSLGKPPTHHQAFNAVYELRRSEIGRDLYVAECDIKGFFDSVDHGVASSAFQGAARRANLDPRAEVLFRAYLNCYSFPINVLAETGPELKRQDPEGIFPWPVSELRDLHNIDPRSLRIGVPQGGAVSGVIANLILDSADKVVESEKARLGASIHYYRFCDDMVLIGPSKKHCGAVFKAYLNQLTVLKLPYHKPEKTSVYCRKHWDHKSKAPYCWSGRQWFGSVPWIQFVGYQIRYDGLVRPRKGSVAKQLNKIIETTDKLKFGLLRESHTSPILASKRQVVASLRAKLTAQGVGRVKGNEVGPKPMCWAAGFKALHDKPFISSSLRSFDGARAKQMARFGRAAIRYGFGRRSGGGNRREPVGYAFSYHAQFTNDGGRNLIINPWRPSNLKDRVLALIFGTIQRISKVWKVVRKMALNSRRILISD